MNKESKEIDGKVKNYLASKTIWGIFLALTPYLSKLIGIDIIENVMEIYEPLMTLLGATIAVYGRVKANGSLNLKRNK